MGACNHVPSRHEVESALRFRAYLSLLQFFGGGVSIHHWLDTVTDVNGIEIFWTLAKWNAVKGCD